MHRSLWTQDSNLTQPMTRDAAPSCDFSPSRRFPSSRALCYATGGLNLMFTARSNMHETPFFLVTLRALLLHRVCVCFIQPARSPLTRGGKKEAQRLRAASNEPIHPEKWPERSAPLELCRRLAQIFEQGSKLWHCCYFLKIHWTKNGRATINWGVFSS